MYKELLEKTKEFEIDIEKAYVAYLASMMVGKDEDDFEDVCEMVYMMYKKDTEANIS